MSAPAAAPSSKQTPAADEQREAEIRAPLMRIRRLVRALISYNLARDAGDAFVRTVPLRLQRLAERQFDFPISRVARGSPVLLIRVPRTASASLSLQLYGRVSHVPHRTALYYRTADPAFFATTTSFAVVRNPWERIQSAYSWLQKGGTALAAPNPRARRAMRRIGSFESFVLDYVAPAAKAGHLRQLDPTLHLQSDYVCDTDGSIIVDRIFKLERIAEVQAFLVAHGILATPEHVNASERAVTPGQTAMTPALADAIGRIYARDIALFGYEPGAPAPADRATGG